MSKRVMLSVIPAFQTEAERYHSGGFDYKALRSAVNGATPIIIYGSRACQQEIAKHAKYVPGPGSGDESNVILAKNKVLLAANRKIDNYISSNEYVDALSICYRIFSEPEYWESSNFGGAAWAKIAKTLLSMAVKKKELDTLRLIAGSKSADPNTDYLAQEIALMKDIVVLMNVFDGLAHNTASIMYNIVEEELKDIGVKEFQNKRFDLRHPETEQDAKSYPVKYMQDILNIMDAKELNDPIDVYNQVKSVIEQPENKHLFDNYISRVKKYPSYGQSDNAEKLKVIRAKKTIMPLFEQVKARMAELVTNKDKLLNIKSGHRMAMENVLYRIRMDAAMIRTTVLNHIGIELARVVNDKAKAIEQLSIEIGFRCEQIIQEAAQKVKEPDVTTIVNLVYTLKQQAGKLEILIAEL